MIIYIIGYMGSGKSSIGKKLANRLNYKFIDLDKEIEKNQNMTIDEIFDFKGEQEFRLIENMVLRNTIPDEDSVMALGGGTPCYGNNMDLINETGLSIYLDVHPKSICHRLRSAKNTRPLIADLDEEDLLDFVTGHLKNRENYYSQAHITVKGEDLRVEDLEFVIREYLA